MLNRIRKKFQRTAAGRAAANSVWMISEKALTLPLGLFTNILIARYLGPEEFGFLAYILAIAAIAGPLSTLGLNAVIVRELRNRPADASVILGTTSAFRSISGLVFYLVNIMGWALFFPSDSKQLYWLIIFGTSYALNGLLVVDFWFQSISKSNVVVKTRVIQFFAFSGLKILAVQLKWPVESVLLIAATELILMPVFLYWAFCRNEKWRFLQKVDWLYGWLLTKETWWLMLSGVAAIIYLKIGQIMLGRMSGLEAVGIYAVASRLSEVWYFIPTALAASIFPYLLDGKKISQEVYQRRLEGSYFILFWSAFSLAGAVSFLADPLINTLYGIEYSSAAVVLKIHIWAGIFVFLRALFSKWLIAEGLMRFSLVSHGAGAIVNIAFNLVLIPKFGAIGAALSALISYAFASFFALLFHSSTRPAAIMMLRAPLNFKSVFRRL